MPRWRRRCLIIGQPITFFVSDFLLAAACRRISFFAPRRPLYADDTIFSRARLPQLPASWRRAPFLRCCRHESHCAYSFRHWAAAATERRQKLPCHFFERRWCQAAAIAAAFAIADIFIFFDSFFDTPYFGDWYWFSFIIFFALFLWAARCHTPAAAAMLTLRFDISSESHWVEEYSNIQSRQSQ